MDKLNEQSQTGNCFELLFDEFKEHSKTERYDDPGRRKMYTYMHSSLLRLYGIRVGNNAIILTGGGIKLTEKMNDVPALELELEKMNYLKDWLLQENIIESTDL